MRFVGYFKPGTGGELALFRRAASIAGMSTAKIEDLWHQKGSSAFRDIEGLVTIPMLTGFLAVLVPEEGGSNAIQEARSEEGRE